LPATYGALQAWQWRGLLRPTQEDQDAMAFRSNWWGVSTLDEVERNAKEQEINDYLQGKLTFPEKQLTLTLASS
jgi:hypothetical protein